MVKKISEQIRKELAANPRSSPTLFHALMTMPHSKLKLLEMMVESKKNPHSNILPKSIR